MIRQLFKLMWNSKRNHALLIIEIFVSFLVLFSVWSLMLYQYNNYKRPMGFDDKNVWVVWFENASAEAGTLPKQRETLLNQVLNFEEVAYVTASHSAIPFGGSTHGTEVKYKGVNVNTDVIIGDASYPLVLNIPIKEGQWFGKQDEGLKYQSVVINQHLKKELFGEGTAIGKILGGEEIEEGEKPKKVVGVVGNFKYKGDFQGVKNVLFQPINAYTPAILIKLKDGADAEFEAKLSKTIASIVKGYQVEIEHLSDKRKSINNMVYVPIIILLIVCGFLIFNVILGLFGILWHNINQRKAEIGTRRAMGATKGLITGQFIGEVLVVATFALILGCFFAVQFPLMNVFGLDNGVYFKAILLSILMIYLLVIVCAFYPSWQASNMHPTMALHEE